MALRRRLPAGVRMYTGDDFNYPALIRGDEQRPLRRAAGHLRRDRAAGGGRAARAGRGRPGRRTTGSWPRPCRCPATCSARRPATTRPASSSSPGSPATRTTSRWSAALQSGRSPRHLARLVRLADAAGLLPDAELAAHRARACCDHGRGRPVVKRFALNQATTQALAAAGPGRRLRRRRRHRRRPVARGRDGVRPGGDAAALMRDAGLAVTSLCRGGFFDDAGWLRREPPRDRRGGGARRTGPGAGLRRPAGRQPRPGRRPARTSARPSERWSRTRSRAGVRLAIEPLHPMFGSDRCVVATLSQALDLAGAAPGGGGRRGRRHLPPVVGRRRVGADRAGRAGAADRLLPGGRLDHPAAGRRAARPRPARHRMRRPAPVPRGRGRGRLRRARSRSRCSTRRCGPDRGVRCSTRPSRATSPSCDERPARGRSSPGRRARGPWSGAAGGSAGA